MLRPASRERTDLSRQTDHQLVAARAVGPFGRRGNTQGDARQRSEERRVGKEWRAQEGTAQAEDGIRDWSVTGVQTCALPISPPIGAAPDSRWIRSIMRPSSNASSGFTRKD